MKNIDRKYLLKKKSKVKLFKKKIVLVNYKSLFLIKKFINKSYNIISSNVSKANKIFQRKIRKFIIYSRYLSLIPYIRRHKLSWK